MTWIELCQSAYDGVFPRVHYKGRTGEVEDLVDRKNKRGCSVNFGDGYNLWFWEVNTGDKRSRYFDELEIIKL